jgi:hypothetical protein
MISTWVAVSEQQFASVHLVKKGVGTHMLKRKKERKKENRQPNMIVNTYGLLAIEQN